MSRLSGRFGTLRWRLMLSFFVAAWAAMVTLEGLFVAVPSLVAMTAPQRPATLAQDLEKLTPQLAPYVTQTPPDRARLTAMLGTFKQPILITEAVTDNLRGTAAIAPGRNAALYVLGTDGSVLAAVPATSGSASGLANIQQAPEARAVVAAALRTGSSAADRVQSTTNGQTVAAAPIVDAGGTVRGALLLGVDLAALARPIYLMNLLALIPSTILFGIIASIFGAIFGMLTARGLTRRLRRLTVAAGAWSTGEFAAAATDPSPDELGQLARDLNRMAEQLRTLLQDRQQLAVVEERNRLARDLHDSVKQQLFALTMLIGTARLEVDESSEVQQLLGEAEGVASTAQQELTGLIHALRPVALVNKDLSGALRELCAGWAQRSGIVCDATIADALSMPPEAEQDIFRTTQEALANIAKHSGATRVEVHAHDEQGMLELRIRDNGRGFDIALAEGRGLGLRSMRERVERLGGTLAISSSVGGTRLEIRVPLALPTPAEGHAAAEAAGATLPARGE